MDDLRFDSIARGLAQAGWSRRRLVRILGGSFVALLGLDAADAGAKKRKKKKKKPPACARSCAGKGCGDADGCGGFCTACPSGKTCQGSQCVPDSCDPPCAGNYICKNGSCACPEGLKECATGGWPGYCHECCLGPGPESAPDTECNGNLGGEYCRADGFVNRCDCLSGQDNCGDGQCVQCCEHQRCQTGYQDEFRFCLGSQCLCNEEAGFIECPNTGHNPGKCRHSSDDVTACGPQCLDCNYNRQYQNFVCQGKCCLPSGALCALANEECCSGLVACQLILEEQTYRCT